MKTGRLLFYSVRDWPRSASKLEITGCGDMV